MTKRLILLALFVFVCLIGHAQLYTFKNFKHKDGLSMAAINCVAQSSDGYLWLGTDGAELVRFDGRSFEEIQLAEGQDNNHHFQHISFDGDDILFAAEFKGFFRYSKSSGKISRLLKTSYKYGDALGVVCKDSVYYMIGKQRIIAQRNKKNTVLFQTPAGKELKVYQIIETQKEVILCSNFGVHVLSERKITPLAKRIKLKESDLVDYRFGFFSNDKLVLIDQHLEKQLEVILNDQGGLFSVRQNELESPLVQDEQIVSTSFNQRAQKQVAVTNKGTIFEISGTKAQRILHNFIEPIASPSAILTDFNGNHWITSTVRGLYQVSQDPFTPVQIDPVYLNDNIRFIFKTDDNQVILSSYPPTTYVGRLAENSVFKSYGFTLKSISDNDHHYFVATTDGVKSFEKGKEISFSHVAFAGENITHVLADENALWVGIHGKGLFRYNLQTGQSTLIKRAKSESAIAPLYVYSSGRSRYGKMLYFGSNFGIWSYNKSNGEYRQVPYALDEFGSYCGVSTVDSRGIIWFTAEKGLIAILPSGKVKAVPIEKYTRTNLFFTLNSDNYGNLIVGTNKGISVLRVNSRAEIIGSETYSGDNGFNGYETHMRSQYQRDGKIFVGTVEGLYCVNTSILAKLGTPGAPIIQDITNRDADQLQSENLYHLQFKVNNPKSWNLKYRYRIVEKGEKWILLGKVDNIHITDLPTGDYTVEVCASYDGINYSTPAKHTIHIEFPIWKSKWFTVGIIAVVILVNIILFAYGRRFDPSRLMQTKDTELHLQIAPSVLMFGTIFVTGSHIAGPLLSSDIELHLPVTIALGLLLFMLYFVALSAKRTGRFGQFKYLLAIAITAVSGHFLWELYVSDLHPFHIIGLVLTSSVAPYVLSKIQYTTAYGLFVFFLAVACSISVDDPVYPKTHFIIAIIAAVSLIIFNSYLRFNSLEKMMFVSGIVNKGNFPVIAFHEDGTVTYVSENISNFVDIDHDQLINKNISYLNNFVLYEDAYREVDVTAEFNDDAPYLVPMVDRQKNARWMQWSYKQYSDSTRVIIGQDVSERVELQNTYELLVQNVEDLIYTVDLDGNFVFVNKTFIDKLGYSKDEVIGQNSLNVVVDSYQEDVRKYYENHFAERKVSTYRELPVKKKNGEVIWLGQHVNTIYAPGSTTYIEGFISLARDITEEREQQRVIKAQRDDITASISYAQKIQYNLLPDTSYFNRYFKEHFLIYRPKDIVSGDFFWMQKIGDQLVLVLADCTGHGVPGAFMTLLGINLLNSVVLEARLTEPGMILNELDKRLEQYFSTRENKEVRDGMEVTICVFDPKQEEISYACAGSRFLIFDNGDFRMHKGNNEHIGDEKPKGFKGYYTQYTQLKNDSALYLFTDGFQDQFGGPRNKKYSFRRLLELIESNGNLPLEDQQKMIEEAFETWKGKQVQTDDVTMIGIKRNPV